MCLWNHSVFSKNRDRLIEHDAVTELFNATVAMADKRGLPARHLSRRVRACCQTRWIVASGVCA